MSAEEPPKKRLVPWKEYFRNRLVKRGLTGLFFLLAWGLPLLLFYLGTRLPGASLLLVLYALFGIRHLAKMMEHAQAVEEVELLTPGKVPQLPAEQTLVRASEEPAPEPERVLLRAASYSEETPSEQLLRPSSSSD